MRFVCATLEFCFRMPWRYWTETGRMWDWNQGWPATLEFSLKIFRPFTTEVKISIFHHCDSLYSRPILVECGLICLWAIKIKFRSGVQVWKNEKKQIRISFAHFCFDCFCQSSPLSGWEVYVGTKLKMANEVSKNKIYELPIKIRKYMHICIFNFVPT